MAQQFFEFSALWIAEQEALFFNIGDRCGWDVASVQRKVGRIENCQLGVFLTYARGQALLGDWICPGVGA